MNYVKIFQIIALTAAIALGVLGLMQTPKWWASAVLMRWIYDLICAARKPH